MTCGKLLVEIERLRSEMNNLATAGASFAEILEVSQRLDGLLLQYHKGGNTVTVKEELEILSKVLANLTKSYEDMANGNYGCTYIQDIYKLQATTYYFVNKLIEETLTRINVK